MSALSIRLRLALLYTLVLGLSLVATDLLVWKLLRREMGLGRATAERIVIEMITATKGAS